MDKRYGAISASRDLREKLMPYKDMLIPVFQQSDDSVLMFVSPEIFEVVSKIDGIKIVSRPSKN